MSDKKYQVDSIPATKQDSQIQAANSLGNSHTNSKRKLSIIQKILPTQFSIDHASDEEIWTGHEKGKGKNLL